MLDDNLKHHIHLHFLVFIAGFTAILGELITIGATALVWYRMLIAGGLMLIYILACNLKLKVSLKALAGFFIAGIIIALHWITFFASIKASNTYITLAMFSTGALFASLIEPIFYKRKIIGYEILFGIIVILGVCLIVQSEFNYLLGILLGIASAFFSSLFAVINGKFVEKHDASVLSFYEFVSGVLFITIYLYITDATFFTDSFFVLSQSDWIYLGILASLCTAYAFIASTYVMKFISPYSVVLAYNLEPVYGFILSAIILLNAGSLSVQFYIGALLILATVIANGIIKQRKKRKSVVSNNNPN